MVTLVSDFVYVVGWTDSQDQNLKANNFRVSNCLPYSSL